MRAIHARSVPESGAIIFYPKSTTRWHLSAAVAIATLAAFPLTVIANPLVSPIIAWPVNDDRWLLVWGTAVGLIEAPIVRAVTHAPWVRCVPLLLVGNFLSGLVGWWRPMHALHGFVWDQLERSMPMGVAHVVSLLLTCWAVALLVETPFIWAACERKPGRAKQAILGSLAAQKASYAILAPITLLIVR